MKVRLGNWDRSAKLALAVGLVLGAGSIAIGQENNTASFQSDSIFAGELRLVQERGAGEGPAWHPEKGLFTSGEGNINLRSPRGEMSVFQTDSGSNGLMFDREGRLIVCEAVRRRIVRWELDGSQTVLADGFDGMKFNQPNDLSMDSSGRIYFTDPQYGDRSAMELVDDAGKQVEGVYRIDPDGTVARIMTHEVDRPNGLVVTADDRYLFVADNNNAVGGARKLWRFDLKADGSIDSSSQTLIHDWGTTRGPDGMKLDQQGRLYVAAGLNQPHLPQETAEQPTAGIYVFSPDGKLLEYLRVPRDETTNCAFGGDDLKTLYVTAGGTLWSVPTHVAGAPVFPPRPAN
ncbi:SMP-30/gluconolactonase/LRE family protein [Rhodopirellula sp. P2]|uniref:SMP-30/gluconolactonase/LRE family protein n=1 Tax=Rhodopirellula sp. P2 TaxID=2127060 RepID=UPI00236766D7|nr:SMP-30/gluconolactonase/LRE family protein [Rhodopirellula sp. P2]WDQ19378.1 SMP-30/gluconolactonase/LRE family protein [Rhodopirellula sp. P2]